MNTINYNNDNTEETMGIYSQPRNMNSPTYPMYSCPLCNYSMPMRDEYDDSDEYDDPGYRQRRRRRRRRRRRYPFYPRPYFFPFIFPYIFPYGRYDDGWDEY